MQKHFTSTAALGSDPDFIKAWTSNPEIVAVLLEAQARLEARQAQSTPAA